MNETFNIILNNQIKLFLADMKKQVNNNTREHSNFGDFSIFYPQKSEGIEHGFFSNKLGLCVKEQLVTGVLSKWLKAVGYKCSVPVNKTYYRMRLFERRSIIAPPYNFPFLFILEINNRRIGYGTYSSLDKYFNKKINLLLLKYNISELIILDASQLNHSNLLSHLTVDFGIVKRVFKVVSLGAFFDQYFSHELYNHYILCVRQAIENANKEIGYQTISNLSAKHLCDFKEKVVEQLYDFNIREVSYQDFDTANGELTQSYKPLLDLEDYNKIIDCCYNNKKLEVLCGQAKFARCFLTSEHLYSIFKSDNQKYYDYSAIVSGYFKSVELLLEEAMEATLSHDNHEKLWIKASKIKSKNKNDPDWRKNPITKKMQVIFLEKYRDSFSDEMGSLIWFLHDNPADWLISEKSRDIIHDCLLNYSSGCRNEHLHKDIISDIKTVVAVRNNTILCLLYILGGYKFYNSVHEDFKKLGGQSTEYNRLYKAISLIPKSNIYNFYIKFNNQEEIMVQRLIKQPDTEFDEYGNVISEINFITVTSFDEDNYDAFTGNIVPNKLLTISKDHMPEEIYWFNNAKGKNKIDW